MKELHILVTNDDGIHAEGIQHLSQVLHQAGQGYRLSIIAPDRERSAVGHAITMHQPLRVEKLSFIHNRELSGWAVNGTPSDCVKLAIEAILDDKPDLVISGINRGSNLGTDVLYSGTVSAAVEGLIMGIPSVAVSLTDRGEEKDYLYAARFVCNLVPELLNSGIPASTLININVPVPPGGILISLTSGSIHAGQPITGWRVNWLMMIRRPQTAIPRRFAKITFQLPRCTLA